MSKITVTTIAGLTSGGDANTVKIESGDAFNVVSGATTLGGDLTVDTSVLKVDASNNRVGVGTASPTSDLHVSGGAGAHVAIQSSAGSHWRLGDAVGSSNGIFVVRDHTNSANRIQILTDGKTQIAQGVTFGSDTAAANTLDDYEEGTFTPSVTFGGASSGVTYSSSRRIGKYTKIGNCVEYFIHVELTSKGSSTGNVQITGLPFTVVGDQHYIPGSVFIAAMASLASGAPIFRAMTGSTVLDCYEITSSSYSGITNSNYTNSTGVQVSGKYYTS